MSTHHGGLGPVRPIRLIELPTDATGVDDVLRAVVPAVHSAVPGCHAVAVAVVRDGSPLTVAASDEATRRCTEAQYRQGCGPCLTATGTGRVTEVDVDDAPSHEEWRAIAHRAGVAATLAVPIPAPDDLAGTLTLHRGTGPWPEGTVTTATILAAHVGHALAVAHRREADRHA
jgi:GAF domain-containing protein